MKDFSWSEFKPTILFLIKFIGIYLVGNLLYGAFVTSYSTKPDPVTHLVTEHTGTLLFICGSTVTIKDHPHKPSTFIIDDTVPVLSVYEGCNGINIMIIFVAFIVAFGPLNRNTLWFIPVGLLIIYLMNLVRIALLFFVSQFLPHFMYFTHKYLFTAFLYAVIFLLWLWWLKRFTIREKNETN